MKLHHELKGLPFFGVEPNTLDIWIGKRVLLRNPEYPADVDVFTVVCTQRLYDGSMALRIVGDQDKHQFGRPARVSEVKPYTSAQ